MLLTIAYLSTSHGVETKKRVECDDNAYYIKIIGMIVPRVEEGV
jgi:hypothetical protein